MINLSFFEIECNEEEQWNTMKRLLWEEVQQGVVVLGS